MDWAVLRYSSQKESTLGLLFDVTDERKFLAFTLEDEFRTVKEYGETRIPAGVYPLGLRVEGGFHARYSQRYPSIHLGMIQILEVPNFTNVLVHVGNKDDDTAGCLLVGNTAQQNITEEGFIGASSSAYKRIYLPMAQAILSGEDCTIEYIDYDVPVVG